MYQKGITYHPSRFREKDSHTDRHIDRQEKRNKYIKKEIFQTDRKIDVSVLSAQLITHKP